MDLGSMDELLAGAALRREVESRIARIASPGPADDIPRGATGGRGREGLSRLLAELEEIAAEAEAALAAARSARLALLDGVAGAERLRRSLAGLDESDRAIAGCPAKDVAAFLMPPLGELLARRARNLGESIDQSESIYRSLVESARYHIRALGKC